VSPLAGSFYSWGGLETNRRHEHELRGVYAKCLAQVNISCGEKFALVHFFPTKNVLNGLSGNFPAATKRFAATLVLFDLPQKSQIIQNAADRLGVAQLAFLHHVHQFVDFEPTGNNFLVLLRLCFSRGQSLGE
jgi:hypothetical protein